MADHTYRILLVRQDGSVEATEVKGFAAETISDGIIHRAKSEMNSNKQSHRYTFGAVFVMQEHGMGVDHVRGRFEHKDADD